MLFEPIGLFSSIQKEPYQAGRQPDELSAPGKIILNSKNNFEQALQDLEGCSHIWIIYHFHRNENWKPLVQTPRVEKKVGVFATRAPYRPNPIGISAVRLISVDGLTINVGPNDILDGTPILDIKPYHPESDCLKDATIAWLSKAEKHAVQFSPLAEEQVEFLQETGIKNFILRQLEYDPLNQDKKRVENKGSFYQLSYRTWRVDFIVLDSTVSILSIHSGYSAEDLLSNEDKYADKDLHRKFIKGSDSI